MKAHDSFITPGSLPEKYNELLESPDDVSSDCCVKDSNNGPGLCQNNKGLDPGGWRVSNRECTQRA